MRPIAIYVAGPIRKGGTIANIRRAIECAETLFKNGFRPFVPHLCVLWDLVHPRDAEEWIKDHDFFWVGRCDGVFRLSGESDGADRECDRARMLAIPVFETLADLLHFDWAPVYVQQGLQYPGRVLACSCEYDEALRKANPNCPVHR